MNECLVSVLLCHHCLRHMVPIAIESYLSQDYPNKELVVVDDGPERIEDLVISIPNCTYIYYPARNLSEKRNIGIRAAKGQFIVHFDADDWSGTLRVTDQVEMLSSHPSARVGGYESAFWYDFVSKRASHYQGSIWGATMIYRREYALDNPWDETRDFIEDQPFLRRARQLNAITAKGGGGNFVATLHDRSTPRSVGGVNWPFVPTETLPEGFRKAAGAA